MISSKDQIQKSIETSNTALSAFALARDQAILVGTKFEAGKVTFFLQLKPGISFCQISEAFSRDDFVPSRTYSEALRTLKLIISRYFREAAI